MRGVREMREERMILFFPNNLECASSTQNAFFVLVGRWHWWKKKCTFFYRNKEQLHWSRPLVSHECRGKKNICLVSVRFSPKKVWKNGQYNSFFFKTKKVNRQKILHIFHSINGQVGMTHRWDMRKKWAVRWKKFKERLATLKFFSWRRNN